MAGNAVGLALASAAMIGVGFTLQKHGVASDFPDIGFATLLHRWRAVVRALLGNWVWLLGMGLGVVGGLVQVQAMANGDLSLVQPLFNTSNLWAMAIGVGPIANHARPARAIFPPSSASAPTSPVSAKSPGR